MSKLIFAVILSILLSSCAPSQTFDGTEVTRNIFRYVDDEAGVVCWIYGGYQKGGIDCMPIGETALRR